MSTFEKQMARIKADRQVFFDTLLRKILSLPSVQGYLQDLRTGETVISGVETEYEYEQSALEDFFEGDTSDILGVVEIWEAVQESVREEADWVTGDIKTFVKDGLKFNAEDTMNEKLDEIQKELEDALKRKHGKTK